MNTLSIGINVYKRLNCLDFVKLPNHTHYLLLKYKQIDKKI